MASWKGRGGGRPGTQPTIQDSNSSQGDPGTNAPQWAGRGGGRFRPQPFVWPSIHHLGDPGSQLFGWSGRGGGRHRPQPEIQDSTQHQGDPGASQSGWSGRGGGRHRPQPEIQDSTQHHGDPGASQSGWAGRGGGRHRPQPQLQPSTQHIGDIGASPAGWKGRGGGRFRPQVPIKSASIMAVQRMAMGAAKVAIGNAAEKVLGLPVLARELEDPMGSYVFALEINGVELAHFQECSGLKGSTEIFEIREGGMNAAVHKIPGQSTWDNLVLRYGVSSEQSMMQLRQVVQQDTYNPNSKSEFDKVKVGSSAGNALANLTAGLFQNKTAPAPKRFNGSIVIKNNRMQEMMRYSFQNSWVVSWEGPKFDSTNSSLAIETIEIAHHGIEVVTNWRTAIPIGWT